MKNDYNDELFDALLKKAFENFDDEDQRENLPELSPEEEQLMHESMEQVGRRLKRQIAKEKARRTFSVKKVFVIAAAVVLLIGMWTVSGSALKKLVYKTKVRIEDNVMKISVDYEGLKKDYKTISKFKNADEIIVPAWLPNDAHLIKIEDTEYLLRIRYKINDKYLDIDEWDWSFDYNASEVQLENNTAEVEKLNIFDMEATLLSVNYENGKEAYILIWGTEETKYKITTDLSYTELQLIIDELTYFRK